MFLRTFSAGLLIPVIAACSQGDSASPMASAEDQEDRVDCALQGAGLYKRGCLVERNESEGKLFLTVRHPDGGFRRFEVLKDGRGMAVADGAEPAEVKMIEGGIEVEVGEDMYRFPAKVKNSATKP